MSKFCPRSCWMPPKSYFSSCFIFRAWIHQKVKKLCSWDWTFTKTSQIKSTVGWLMKQARKLTDLYSSNYLLEVLRGKQIKLIHVVSDFFSNQFSWITAEPHFKKHTYSTLIQPSVTWSKCNIPFIDHINIQTSQIFFYWNPSMR